MPLIGSKNEGGFTGCGKLQMRHCFERARIYPCRKCLNIGRGFNP